MRSWLRPAILLSFTFSTLLVGQASVPGGKGCPPQRGFSSADEQNSITTSFTEENITLRITGYCEPSEPQCPFQAEILALPAVFESIEQVEYSFAPDHQTVLTAKENASTQYSFTAKHLFGEDIHAMVTVRHRWSAPGRTISITGRIPFAAEVTPKLPSGLRFEDKYWEESLEGAPSGHHRFRIWLRGDEKALERIRSVEYRLPAAYFTQTSVVAIPRTEYFLEGIAPTNSSWNISANIHWKDGTLSIHKIPFLPR